jgi:hypothetical protein
MAPLGAALEAGLFAVVAAHNRGNLDADRPSRQLTAEPPVIGARRACASVDKAELMIVGVV